MKFSTVTALPDGRIAVTAWPETDIEKKALKLYLDRHGSQLANAYDGHGVVIDMTNTFANSAPISLVFEPAPSAPPAAPKAPDA